MCFSFWFWRHVRADRTNSDDENAFCLRLSLAFIFKQNNFLKMSRVGSQCLLKCLVKLCCFQKDEKRKMENLAIYHKSCHLAFSISSFMSLEALGQDKGGLTKIKTFKEFVAILKMYIFSFPHMILTVRCDFS